MFVAHVSLLAHTYQAIVVLLPKLINAPTKVRTGCFVPWGRGHFCGIHIHYCLLFFCIVLIIMPLLQLSHHYIHIVSNIFTSHFFGALPQTEKYGEQVENHFSEMKGNVRNVTSWKRWGTMGCLHQNRNSFITPSRINWSVLTRRVMASARVLIAWRG